MSQINGNASYVRDLQGDTLESSDTQATSQEYSRLTDIEVQNRVDKCFELRYNSDKPILQREWIEYCKKHYGDKSVPQYTNYWMKAKNDYEEQWRANLEGMLKPATDNLLRMLNSNSEAIQQRAIDQIMKYTGNDIQKHLIKGQIENIQIGFGLADE